MALMLLKDYLKRENKTLRLFAKEIGVSESFIYQVSCGNKRFSQKLAIKIETMTEAEVSRSEILWPEMYTDKLPCGSQQMRFSPKVEAPSADG